MAISSIEAAGATTAAASPAGALDAIEASRLPLPPLVDLPRRLQVLRMSVRQGAFVRAAQRRHGDVFGVDIATGGDPPLTVVNHPDHVKSLFTADPRLAPSLTRESALRPIVGDRAVLTAIGPRHMRQRKLLLPPFHGEAIARYQQQIQAAAEREIAEWPVGRPFALAPAAQAITLDVILAGIFGIEGRPAPGTHEHRLRRIVRGILAASVGPGAKLAELLNRGRDEAVGPQRLAMRMLDRAIYPVIAERRATHEPGARHDVLSLLLDAETEDGERLTDLELRNELLTLVLAGHETTASTLAWTFERLLRTPDAYARLCDVARSGEDDDGYLDAVIHESMRIRPVIPTIAREVTVPWRFGDHAVPAGSWVLISILLLHQRPDVYPDPRAFRPERFVGVKPGTYTWIPFGGGIRRCLGSALAMAELRIVLREIVRRTEMTAPDPAAEPGRYRNVTMIPARGGRLVVTARRAAA
ncbi:cytochrome P450 [Patulibacter medicamentivorans]|uniref:Cytochrome P450 n=1 Tax=Patulibacter medicamentivorans TaxID=1097667 RepID=H0E249_9ACTN|nr:cytochrome P450 [Patulibacter medicamentivorans]EHN12259.1 cytochrome P450 [Patulibacter medicamentivorans]